MDPLRPFDASGEFRTTGNNHIRELAVRGAGATVGTSSVGLGVQIAATVALARLLTPADYGVVTMVVTASQLLSKFGSNGLTEAVLQRESLDHRLASDLFWINSGVALCASLLFAASGSVLSRFYGDPRVDHIVLAMSLSILLGCLPVLHTALLRRAMRFATASMNELMARAVSLAVAIVFALAGWGYWALVAGAITLPVVSGIGAWTYCKWLPGRPRVGVYDTAATLKFAASVYVRFGLNYFSRNLDNVLLGWRFDASALGFYKKAYDLFALSAYQLVSPLTLVAVAALSRVRDRPREYQKYLLNALNVTAFIGMALGGTLTLVGRDIIAVLLGQAWETSADIFVMFGPGIGVMMLYGTHGWVHLSSGRADRFLRWGIVECAVTGVLLGLALRWGPVGVAAAWTMSYWLLVIPALWYACRETEMGVGTIIGAVWRYVAAAVAVSIGCQVFLPQVANVADPFYGLAAVLRIAWVSCFALILYTGIVVLLHWSGRPVYRVAGLLQDMTAGTRRWRAGKEPRGQVEATGLAPGEEGTSTER